MNLNTSEISRQAFAEREPSLQKRIKDFAKGERWFEEATATGGSKSGKAVTTGVLRHVHGFPKCRRHEGGAGG